MLMTSFICQDFEAECLKPGPAEQLEGIGLTLLKWISSHRGLTFAAHSHDVKVAR